MHWLEIFGADHQFLIYLVLFFAVIIEGDATLLIFGVLSRERIIKIPELFLVAIIAGFIHDLSFWYIGKKLASTKKEKIFCIKISRVKSFLERFDGSMGIFVLLSKFIWNFNRVILVASGYSGFPFKKFIRYSIPGVILWAISFISIGYVFADQTKIFKHSLRNIGFGILGLIVAMAFFEIYLKKIVQKYIFNGTKKEEISIDK